MRTSRTAALRRQLNTIAEELDRLESRPEEPPVGAVIRFNMHFNGSGTVYSYAAIRAGDGRWYVTGTETRARSWDELLDWMEQGTHSYMHLRPSSCNQMTEIGG